MKKSRPYSDTRKQRTVAGMNARANPKSRSTSRARSQVRIIAGQWRGRKLEFPSVPGLRPSGDRVRETLFNWLQQQVVDSRCLDMFAGSGALGFEALSRGAGQVDLYELSASAADALRQNASRLKAERLAIYQADVLGARFADQPPYDLVFVDPPFAEHLHARALDVLLQNNLLAAAGWLYIEQPRQQVLQDLPDSLQCYRQRDIGDVNLSLYRYLAPESDCA